MKEVKHPRIQFQHSIRRKLSKESIKEIQKLHAKGVSLRVLAKQFGVSGVTIFYHTHKEHKRKVILKAIERAKNEYKRNPELARKRSKERYQRMKELYPTEMREYWNKRYYARKANRSKVKS